jgi:hypothetical protein
MPRDSGRYPSGQRGQTVNLLANAFGGSNPPLPTTVSTGLRSLDAAGDLHPRLVVPFVRSARVVVSMRELLSCGNSSAVERQPSKLGVAGSNPVSRSRTAEARFAHVAQLAEHALGKGEVSGSIPDMGSISCVVVRPGAAAGTAEINVATGE